MKLCKWFLLLLVILIFITILPLGCSSGEEELKEFTLEELKEFDGKDGRPAYVGYNGKVYDVTGLENSTDGGHFDLHMAGNDLTEFMKDAPHSKENLFETADVVGKFIE